MRIRIMQRRTLIMLLTAVAVAAAAWPFTTRAQPAAVAPPWPQRPVKFILPLGPGSGSDIGARLFAERLTARWGQPVVIENRPGGDSFVAITAFIGAHDDHTLLFAPTSTFTAHTILHSKLPYDPRDLMPIARVTNTLIALSVPASLNVGTVKDLVALARARPGKLNRASITGALDFVLSGFLKGADLTMEKVPLPRSGPGGHRPRRRPHPGLYGGVRHRAVAAAGRHRQGGGDDQPPARPTAPSIPTAAEAGYPALEFDGLVGLFGPTSMAPALRDRIANDIREVAADPFIGQRLIATGQILNPGTGAEFAAAIDEQKSKLAAIAKALDIKPED